MDVRLTWTDCDEARDYVVPKVLSPRDLVSRPDNMDETVLHTTNTIQTTFVSDETVFNVLSLADEYQVDLLIKRCIEYLSKKCNDPNATLTEQVNILLCAERYSLKELYNACFDTVARASPYLLKQVNEFVKLTEETREKFKRLRSQALDIKLTGNTLLKRRMKVTCKTT